MKQTILCAGAVLLALAGNVLAGYVEVGYGMFEYEGLFMPFGGVARTSRKFQILVLNSELSGFPTNRNVNGLAFHCGTGQPHEGVYSNVHVWVCHTSLSALTTNFSTNYDGNAPVSVFSETTHDFHWTQNAWNTLWFEDVFSYDDTNNVIFEFRYSGTDGGNLGVRFYTGWFTRMLDADDNAATTGNWQDGMIGLRLFYPAYLDTDADSLPDDWETSHFLDISTWTGHDDPDGDGADNVTEHISRTIPTNRTDVFHITQFEETPNGLELSWSSHTGCLYHVQMSSNAVTWTDLPNQTNLPGSDAIMVYTNTTPANPPLFYHIRVEQDPN